MVSSGGSLLLNQSSSSGSATLDGLLDGNYTVSAWLNGVRIVNAVFALNSSRNMVFAANVTSLVVTARDVLGFPIQGAKVSVVSESFSFSGSTDDAGKYSLKPLPTTRVRLVVDSRLERREAFLDLDGAEVEASLVFLLSTYTVALTIALIVLLLAIIPKTRRGLRKLIPVEVSFEPETRDLATQYYDLLSSIRLKVEEALEVKGREVSILVAGNRILPRVTEDDHAAFLLSDDSFTPPRREVRILKELTDLNSSVASLSKLIRIYSEETGLRILGILVCDEVTDVMLDSLKGLDVEVVFLRRN